MRTFVSKGVLAAMLIVTAAAAQPNTLGTVVSVSDQRLVIDTSAGRLHLKSDALPSRAGPDEATIISNARARQAGRWRALTIALLVVAAATVAYAVGVTR